MLKKIFSKNKNIAIALVAIVIGLVGGSFASAPLYRLFCQVTGFAGTPQNASQNGNALVAGNNTSITPEVIKNFHPLTIFFDKTIDTNMPIKVTIQTPRVDVAVNQIKRVVYRVENLTDKPLNFTSTYNATPDKYARQIIKTECFCFVKQLLQPGEKKDLSVVFFISPEIINAEGAEKIRELTIGYHFFQDRS
ncbi:MAG: cytochrome c oxidase assembly protein [Hydrotalea sp.]|nr:cytochrome c oxidase assembly protein [Hydrotalea sp.]